MDRETRHELDRLYANFTEALKDVRLAADEEAEANAWRRIRTTAWELDQVLPSVGTRPAG